MHSEKITEHTCILVLNDTSSLFENKFQVDGKTLFFTFFCERNIITHCYLFSIIIQYFFIRI